MSNFFLDSAAPSFWFWPRPQSIDTQFQGNPGGVASNTPGWEKFAIFDFKRHLSWKGYRPIATELYRKPGGGQIVICVGSDGLEWPYLRGQIFRRIVMTLWNTLPQSLRLFDDHEQFRKQYWVKTYYAALLPRRGRILRRTLSVRLSVRPSRYECHVAPPSELQWHWWPHNVRPSRPHKLVILTSLLVNS